MSKTILNLSFSTNCTVFVVCFLLCLCKSIYANDSLKLLDAINTNNQLSIEKIYVTKYNEKACRNFTVITKESGYYPISFFILGSKMVNKGFISYPLLINGECVDTIIPKSAEWQVCDLSSKDQKVYLKEGNNTITVIGTQKDIPEVALVLQPTEKDNFKTNYNNYIEDLKSNIKEKVVKNKRSVDSYIHWNPDLSSFPHDYEYRLSELLDIHLTILIC
ncbi:MAG: hypothetical protein IJL54_04940 [Prevotella sp.]|nr:hypothetical protein [Prevotella sp.]